MNSPFTPANDGQRHTHCIKCGSEQVTDIFVDDLQKFHCTSCGLVYERALIIDPTIHWWIDETGEYWHETAGVFLYNSAGKFLFFDRIKSPYGLTVPAGHVDAGEDITQAAVREVGEEVGIAIALTDITHVASCDIHGDLCRRGVDIHRWQVFAALVLSPPSLVMSDEGVRPVWLTLDQALEHNPTFAVRYLITHFAAPLQELAAG